MRGDRCFEDATGERAASAREPAGRSPAGSDPPVTVGGDPTAGPRGRARADGGSLGRQDQGHAGLRPQRLRVGGDSAQPLGGDREQQVVEHCRVVVGDDKQIDRQFDRARHCRRVGSSSRRWIVGGDALLRALIAAAAFASGCFMAGPPSRRGVLLLPRTCGESVDAAPWLDRGSVAVA